jgi:hypothetical protein
LGGAWGLYNARDRGKSAFIYSKIKDPNVAINYHKPGEKFNKGNDQDFLGHHVYPVIRDNCMVHDAYLCKQFGGQPFPTKRNGNCYICNAGPCDPINGNFEHICPVECRPKDHPSNFLTQYFYFRAIFQ